MAIESGTHDTVLVPQNEDGAENGTRNIGHESTSSPEHIPNGPNSDMGQPPQVEGDQPIDPDVAEPQEEAQAESNPGPSKMSQTLVLEIRALQDRLIQLEEQAASELNIEPKGTRPEGQPEVSDELKDKELRKHIRRAHRNRKWVEKHEEQAERTTEERTSYGTIGSPYMHQVTEEGGIRRGPFRKYNDSDREREYWIDTKPKPAHGIRPMTSLRPIYTRKLGPPTQWDTSDSEEWDSEDSTASRDFDYFRARLRGDFEWELDRLNSQKRRYEQHKSRKHERELARVAEEERKKERERRQAAGETEDGQQDSGSLDGEAGDGAEPQKPTEISALPGLQSLEWNMFRAARNIPINSSHSIYILIGEPKIWNDAFSHFFGYKFRASVGSKAYANNIAAAKNDTSGANPNAPAKQPTSHPTRQDGQSPLPERIRIQSKQLIKTLSVIHGSELVPPDDADRNYSVVMLRPYRMLTYYKDEIRDWQTKLIEELHPADTNEPAEKSAATATDASPGEFLLHLNHSSNLNNTETAEPDVPPEEGKPKVEDPEGFSRSETTLMHLPCLLEFVDQYIAEKMAYVNSPRCEKISFSDIWFLFKPGDFVISADGKQAYQVIKFVSGRHIGTNRLNTYIAKDREESDESKQDLEIHCAYVHYDGRQLGPVLKSFTVKKFDGEKAVTALDVYPLRFHVLKNLNARTLKPKQSAAELEEVIEKGVAELRAKLINRGKLFVDVAAVKHMYYAGLTVDTRDEVESQVMVDFEEAFMVEKNRDWRPLITRFVGASPLADTTENDDGCKADCCRGENVHDDSYVENKRHQDFINSMMADIEDNPRKLPSVSIFPRTLEDLKTEDNALKDDELLIMSSFVFGFVLRDRTWGESSHHMIT